MRATSGGIEKRGAPGARARSRAAAALALLGALTLVLSACNIGGLGGGPTGPNLAASQVFTWPYVDASDTMGYNTVLDPALIITAKDYAMVNMLYTNLVTFTPTLGIAPDAATRWDIDSTGTIYTFHLRPGLKFSDGKPITAADFAYSLDRSLDPGLCSSQDSATYTPLNECIQIAAAHLNLLLGAGGRLSGSQGTLISTGDNPNFALNVIDPLTLRIRLSSPGRYFLESLTYPTGDVVEQSLLSQYPTGKWVDHLDTSGCSGPFQIKSYGDGKVMTLVPNPYWETAFGKKLTLTQIVRPVISSIQAEYQAYRAGQYDFTDVSLDQYQFARGQLDFHDVIALETDYFGLNFTQAPFDNLQVRQAFDLALNKQLLVDSLEKGGAVPTNHIVPQGMPGYYPSLTNPPQDGTQSLTGNASAAGSLLGKAQSNCSSDVFANNPDYCAYIFGKTPKEIDLYVPQENPAGVNIANTAAQIWNQALNVNVVVKQIGFDQLAGYLGDAPTVNPMGLWEIGWIADYPDPQDWLSIQFATGAPDNSGGMSDPAFDKLVAAADVEQNPVKRMQDYNQAEQIAINDVGWIPYQQSKIAWRLRTYVHGFNYNAMGVMVDIDWPSVYVSAS